VSLRTVFERPVSAPDSSGKSTLAVASRLARDSRTRARAVARSRLCVSTVPISRVSVGSSNRPHQRDKSRCGEATGKPAACFHSAGSTTLDPVPAWNPAQAGSPSAASSHSRRNRGAGKNRSGRTNMAIHTPPSSPSLARNFASHRFPGIRAMRL
jgi:hypothetical protein